MRQLFTLVLLVGFVLGMALPAPVAAEGRLDPELLQLQPEELPAGFVEVPERREREDLDSATRVMLWYERHNDAPAPGDVTDLTVDILAMDSVEAAQTLHQQDQAWLVAKGWVTEPAPVALGDEATVARVPFDNGTPYPAEAVLVCFRRGAVVVTVETWDFTDQPNLERAMSVAPLLDARAQAVQIAP